MEPTPPVDEEIDLIRQSNPDKFYIENDLTSEAEDEPIYESSNAISDNQINDDLESESKSPSSVTV
jgi:hypothetical protein